MSRITWVAGALAVTGIISGCATQAVRGNASPEEALALLDRTCGKTAPGAGVSELTGSVWMKANSPEASGQFPATLKVSGDERIDMEITNLVGGPVASIRVDGGKYEIRAHGKGKGGKDLVQKGADTWGGIPLRWAPALFLGRVPCPSDAQRASAKLRVDEKGSLVIDAEGESYVYGYRSWAGSPWPEKLTWRRTASGGAKNEATEVAFEFDQPDGKSNVAKKWEARSSRGEVKVRWKDRDVRR